MAADTYSNTLGVLLMGTGNDNNTWGANQNSSVFQIFEDAIANALTSSVTGGTLDLSGSPPPAAASQVRYAALIFTGVLGSAQSIKVPNLTKFWFVSNQTSGAFALTFKTPSGSASTSIPQNSGWQVVYCDGSNNIVVHPFNTKQIQMPDGSVSAPAYSDINETNSGWYRAGTQDWRLAINGVDVLQATGTGAGSPSIVNIVSPGVLQIAGAQVIPPGTEVAGAFIELPGGGWLWEDGTAYSRSIAAGGSVDTYKALYNAITKQVTGTTNGTTTISAVSADIRFKGLKGAKIEGNNIPSNTTITAITSNTLTISQAATGSGSGITFTIFPFGNGNGSTTFNVPDRRDRTLVGRGDMNGSDAARLSVNDGTQLSTTGGEETHTLVTNEIPSHQHNVYLHDPQHTHTTNAIISVAGTNAGAGQGNPGTATINPASTGITIGSVNGVANDNQTAATGGGAAHNNMQPFGMTNYIIKL